MPRSTPRITINRPHYIKQHRSIAETDSEVNDGDDIDEVAVKMTLRRRQWQGRPSINLQIDTQQGGGEGDHLVMSYYCNTAPTSLHLSAVGNRALMHVRGLFESLWTAWSCPESERCTVLYRGTLGSRCDRRVVYESRTEECQCLTGAQTFASFKVPSSACVEASLLAPKNVLYIPRLRLGAAHWTQKVTPIPNLELRQLRRTPQ